MDHLNKHQIILLSILVCFVTSIATGITVVSLMDQSPQPVTQTINRVIQNTIEKVVPTDNGTKQTNTVVVKEEDLTIGAIDKNSNSIVRVLGPLATSTESFLSDGIVVSDKGYVIADRAAILQSNSYIGVFPDGSKIELAPIANSETSGLILLVAKPRADQKITFTPIVLSDSSNVKLGQSVISLSGETKNTVNIGNLISVDNPDGKGISAINVSSEVANSLPGGMLLNLAGEVIGVHIGWDKQVFIPSNVVKDSIAALTPKQ